MVSKYKHLFLKLENGVRSFNHLYKVCRITYNTSFIYLLLILFFIMYYFLGIFTIIF